MSRELVPDESEFPLNLQKLLYRYRFQSEDIKLVREGLGLVIPKGDPDLQFSKFHYDLLVLFRRIKVLLRQYKGSFYINLKSVSILKSIADERVYINLEKQQCSEITEERLREIISKSLEA